MSQKILAIYYSLYTLCVSYIRSNILVKELILGTLMNSPDYGYNIKSSFFSRMLDDFGINDGQLYPALKKMEAHGLIVREIEYRDEGPNRHLFSITDSGRKEFSQWLESREGEEKGFRYELIRRDPFLLKCMYLKYLEPAQAGDKIIIHRREVEKSIKEYQAAKEDMEIRKVDFERILIVDYALRCQEMRLKWLDELKATIVKKENLEGRK